MEINFYTEGVDLPINNPEEKKDWIRRVIASHGKRTGTISYVFCNDEKILAVNNEFLKHNYYTDVITFDYCKGKLVSGDIYISTDTVESNSKLFKTDYKEELDRAIIHGILHLCGINDKGPGEREIMEVEENKALDLRVKMQ